MIHVNGGGGVIFVEVQSSTTNIPGGVEEDNEFYKDAAYKNKDNRLVIGERIACESSPDYSNTSTNWWIPATISNEAGLQGRLHHHLPPPGAQRDRQVAVAARGVSNRGRTKSVVGPPETGRGYRGEEGRHRCSLRSETISHLP